MKYLDTLLVVVRYLGSKTYCWKTIEVELKDPSVMLIVSLVAGTIGVDRFMIGDTAMGILKLLTLGLCGILTIIDWFTIGKRQKNLTLIIS